MNLTLLIQMATQLGLPATAILFLLALLIYIGKGAVALAVENQRLVTSRRNDRLDAVRKANLLLKEINRSSVSDLESENLKATVLEIAGVRGQIGNESSTVSSAVIDNEQGYNRFNNQNLLISLFSSVLYHHCL